MPKIILTEEAHRAVRAETIGDFRDTSRVLPDGTREVPVSDDVAARVEAVRLPGETVSDTILRTIALSRRRVS